MSVSVCVCIIVERMQEHIKEGQYGMASVYLDWPTLGLENKLAPRCTDRKKVQQAFNQDDVMVVKKMVKQLLNFPFLTCRPVIQRGLHAFTHSLP